MKLADGNIEEYKREGLTIPDYKLSEKLIEQLSDDIGELVEAFPEIPSAIGSAGKSTSHPISSSSSSRNSRKKRRSRRSSSRSRSKDSPSTKGATTFSKSFVVIGRATWSWFLDLFYAKSLLATVLITLSPLGCRAS